MNEHPDNYGMIVPFPDPALTSVESPKRADWFGIAKSICHAPREQVRVELNDVQAGSILKEVRRG